jgi:hypothetical protein
MTTLDWESTTSLRGQTYYKSSIEGLVEFRISPVSPTLDAAVILCIYLLDPLFEESNYTLMSPHTHDIEPLKAFCENFVRVLTVAP